MKTETIKFNWNDPKTVKQAERKKSRLENAGYTLQSERATLSGGVLIYSL